MPAMTVRNAQLPSIAIGILDHRPAAHESPGSAGVVHESTVCTRVERERESA